MVQIIFNDQERWDTTRRRLSLPDAAMPGYHSLSREVSNVIRALEQKERK